VATFVEDRSDTAVEPLIRMYTALVQRKQFSAYGTPDFIRAVWWEFRKTLSPFVSAHIFHAILNQHICSSILLLRAGSTVHVAWGASDYHFNRFHPTHGLHWFLIEQFNREGLQIYDLGGANDQSRSGVFAFKKHMGGELVTLPALRLIFI
jgi:CelD/BcsL family acetyltransferase involved in cellulose biosynthesis